MKSSTTYSYEYKNICLKFWYFREHSYLNALEVLLMGSFYGDESIWRSDLAYPRQIWHRAVVQIDSQLHGTYDSIAIRATINGIQIKY